MGIFREIGSLFNKRKPDFDARNYGYDKMSHLFKAYTEDFEIEERNTDKSRIKHYYIRNIIKRPLSAVSSSPTDADKKTVATTDAKSQEVTAKPTNQNARKKGRQNKKPQDAVVAENPPKELPAVQHKEEQQAVENIAQNDSPNRMLFPAAGNKITADDTKKRKSELRKILSLYFQRNHKSSGSLLIPMSMSAISRTVVVDSMSLN
ncbi:OST-HTH/LOTUS domain-containing protein [Sphingobacterium sp. E70]|uniref:OST-HTH/LOTUS domain-containing protein n=1 Tax=Sphingobacterium sp. E70 TaxID=2853439 RepID=UPI00211C3C0D|nr:OST-HTH/LOTUS domain-containing protein [Sphingobacterium sp. E70]ULT26154.1 OST-HTH/LOTUS domain-containing protein [Sphingobacterium sp. E70]